MEESSGKALCDRRPSGVYGVPEDGSSTYFIEKPPNNINDPCYCRYLWDEANTCFNNRVWVASGEEYVCRDGEEYVVDIRPEIYCNGSYHISRQYLRGRVRLHVEPEVSTAFIVGGVLHRFKTFAPRHILYGVEGLSETGVKEYRLVDGDYRFSEIRDDSGFYGFTYHEAVWNAYPPAVGEKFILDSVSGGNGTYVLDFTILGGVEALDNLTLTVLSVGDRVNRARDDVCGYLDVCPGRQYCVDGRCLDTADLDGRTIQLKNCLKEAAETELTFDAPETVSEGGNVTLKARLTGGGRPLSGLKISFQCAGVGWSEVETDGDGEAEYTFTLPGTTACTAKYGGGWVYAPAGAARTIKTVPPAFNLSIWILSTSVFLLLAVGFLVAEGRYTFHDFIETFKGFFR